MILLVRDPRAVYKSRREEKVARWCKNVAPCYNMAVSCNITYHDLQVMLPDGVKMLHHATIWPSAATSHIKISRYCYKFKAPWQYSAVTCNITYQDLQIMVQNPGTMTITVSCNKAPWLYLAVSWYTHNIKYQLGQWPEGFAAFTVMTSSLWNGTIILHHCNSFW